MRQGFRSWRLVGPFFHVVTAQAGCNPVLERQRRQLMPNTTGEMTRTSVREIREDNRSVQCMSAWYLYLTASAIWWGDVEVQDPAAKITT